MEYGSRESASDPTHTLPMDYEATRQPDRTDDEWVTNQLFPLKTWEWFDGAQE